MAGRNLKSLSREELSSFFDSFDAVLSDCDGVLWIGQNAVPGSPETVKKLKEGGKKFFYVTNNSMKTRVELLEKINALNFKAEPEEIMCTSYLVAVYLKRINFTKKVFIVGSAGISKELDLAGIRHTGVGPDCLTTDLKTFVTNFKPDPEIGAVVVGFDEHISYPKMMRAASYLNNPDVLFIATNKDARLPTPTGSVPGAGTMVAGIEACSGRKAVVLGKPAPFIRQAILENYGVDPDKTLFIGDRADTDILLGKRCGFKTLLVLTGVTNENDLKRWKDSKDLEEKDLVPDFYTESIADLLPSL